MSIVVVNNFVTLITNLMKPIENVNLTEDCQYYDPNRICSNHLYYCSHDYNEDKYSFSKDCIRKTPIEKDCYNLSDCGSNQFCANNVCECQL